MGKRIVVNAGITETRIAVLENNVLVELYLERRRQRSIVGSVYKGTVTNVLPGMQAAFVDVGLAKDAFLYAGDYTENVGDFAREMLASEEESDPEVDVDEEIPRREPTTPIEQLLRKGQEVLVQVSKESLGTKGARVTSFISLPGRYLVYMPQTSHIGVSRRIRDERERDRLRAVLREQEAPGGGFIVRTNAEGKGAEEFAADVAFLGRLWTQINTRFEQSRPPAVLHQEMDLTFRVIRDLMSPDVEEFLVDDGEVYAKCGSDVQALVPALAERVKRYEGRTPIFDAYGIEREIEKAVRRRVWLKSGGYIVIDHTEALVSIDVNTGKYVGKRDFEQTVLKINLEAVNEVVRQIRLRDLGGIIIIDFIDMERAEHRAEVEKALKRALVDDKARTNVLDISELGLVEMTRKRVRQDLRSLLTTACPTCKGTGVIRSDATLTAEILRAIRAKVADETSPEAPAAGREAAAAGREVIVRAHPDLVQYLESDGKEAVRQLGASLGVPVIVQTQGGHPGREEYEIQVR